MTASGLWKRLQSFTLLSIAEGVVTFVAFLVGSYYLGLFSSGSALYGTTLWEVLQNPTAHLLLIANITGASLTEEIAFRGYLISRMRGWHQRPSWKAVVILMSAASFAIDHFFELRSEEPAILWSTITSIFVFGVIFAWSYFETRNLVIPILAHAFNDAFAFYMPNASSRDVDVMILSIPGGDDRAT